MKVKEERYAVAVRDEDSLFLFLWVKRSERGDFYAILPRPHDTSINAHGSYHADGRYHVKFQHKFKIMCRQKQRPDQNFVGSEHLLDQKVNPADPRSIGEKCDPSEWSDVFEIPSVELGSGAQIIHLSADLISDGYSPNLVPNARKIRQRRYRDFSPFLILTLYEMPPLRC